MADDGKPECFGHYMELNTPQEASGECSAQCKERFNCFKITEEISPLGRNTQSVEQLVNERKNHGH